MSNSDNSLRIWETSKFKKDALVVVLAEHIMDKSNALLIRNIIYFWHN